MDSINIVLVQMDLAHQEIRRDFPLSKDQLATNLNPGLNDQNKFPTKLSSFDHLFTVYFSVLRLMGFHDKCRCLATYAIKECQTDSVDVT